MRTSNPSSPRTSRARTAGVVTVVLGVASLATFGLLSLPSLVCGWLYLRHRGGLARIDDRDGSLFLVGMGLAGLPLLCWVLLGPFVLAGAG